MGMDTAAVAALAGKLEVFSILTDALSVRSSCGFSLEGCLVLDLVSDLQILGRH